MVRDLDIRPLRPDDIESFIRFSHYAFHGRSLEQRRADFRGRVTPERNVLVAFEDGEIVSQVMMYDFAIWIDGARYPTGGLANVVTAPEKSRRGYASQVLRASLKWMRDELGQCLSTLYPTVYPIYRGLGWTLADESQRISGPPTAFRPNAALPVDPESRLVRRLAEAADVETLRSLYERFARERSVYLDRPGWYWEARVLRLEREDPRWIGFWFGSDGALSGYLVYSFEGPHTSTLHVYEVVALRPEAYHGILTFLSAHNLADEIVLSAGRDVPWRSLVANPQALDIRIDDKSNMMVRIVDLPDAIARRRAPHGNDLASVSLQVTDESATWNAGIWRVQTQDGRWTARRSEEGTPDAVADISAIGGLFTGFTTVAEAIDTGLLQANERCRPTLEALFRTKYSPTSRDHF